MMRRLTTQMLFLLLIGWSTAMAEDLICINTSATPFTGVADNVEVPPGADCFMNGANVENVKVFGAFRALATFFRGDVQGEPGHRFVQLSREGGGNAVQGDVQINGGVGPGTSVVLATMIHGDLQAEENSNPLAFAANVIGGDLHVFRNTGSFRNFPGTSAFIGGNTIGGDLRCKENSPPPSVSPVAGANTVDGNKEDQCSADLGF